MPRLTVLSIAIALALGWTSTAHAQTIVSGYGLANTATTPGFTDLDDAANGVHAGFGASAAIVKGWFGVEGDVTLTPGAFSGGDLVTSSRLGTASANVIAIPLRWRSLQLYGSFGFGAAHIKSVDVAKLFVVDSTHSMATASVGAWIWMTPRLGIRAGIRFIRSLDEIESDSLESWQPSVGMSFRF